MDKKVLNNIGIALGQIKVFARLIEDGALGCHTATSKADIIDQALSLSQVIGEKADFCISAIDEKI